MTAATDRTRVRPPAAALLTVAAAYGLVQLVVTRRIPLGWDETVYVSQVAHGVPAAVFSAPRARGIVLLMAPVSLLTPSTAAVRIYAILLSAAGLAVAFWPWLRLRGSMVVPLAAGLYATQWLSVFYGGEAMPNPYVALGAVAAVGWFLRLTTRPAPGAAGPPAGRARAVAGLAIALAVVGLMRPFDAVWVALPLLVVAVARRHRTAAAAVSAGVAVGWVEWAVEAYLWYGGPLARLHAAGSDNETGLHFSLGAHLRALNGPLLCRPPSDCGGYPPLDVLWFAAIPVLALAGLAVLRRERSPHLPAAALAAVSAVTMAASYILVVGYAAPRFLMPAYALAALPVAEGVIGLCRLAPGRLRGPAAIVAGAGVLAYAGVQVGTLGRLVSFEDRVRTADGQVASGLRAMGVTQPCLLYGRDAVQIAYYLRCTSDGIMTNWGGARPPAEITAALAAGRRVVVTARTRRPPAAFLATWRRRTITGVTANGHWYAYLPPATAAPATARSGSSRAASGAGPRSCCTATTGPGGRCATSTPTC